MELCGFQNKPVWIAPLYLWGTSCVSPDPSSWIHASAPLQQSCLCLPPNRSILQQIQSQERISFQKYNTPTSGERLLWRVTLSSQTTFRTQQAIVYWTLKSNIYLFGTSATSLVAPGTSMHGFSCHSFHDQTDRHAFCEKEIWVREIIAGLIDTSLQACLDPRMTTVPAVPASHPRTEFPHWRSNVMQTFNVLSPWCPMLSQ